MDAMRFKEGTPVHYWWEGKIATGLVTGHLHQYVLIADARQRAVKANQVWLPDEEAPALQEPAGHPEWPFPRVENTEPTAS